MTDHRWFGAGLSMQLYHAWLTDGTAFMLACARLRRRWRENT